MEKMLTTNNLLAKGEEILQVTSELWTVVPTEVFQEIKMAPSNLKSQSEKESTHEND